MPKFNIYTRPRNLGTSYKAVRDHKTLLPHTVEADNPEQACRQFQGDSPIYFSQFHKPAVWGTQASPANVISGEMYAEEEKLDSDEEE